MEAALVEEVLRGVPDPEIPKINIVDLGMVQSWAEEDRVLSVTLIPTFVGCSAQTIIADTVRRELLRVFPDCEVVVRFSLETAWSTSRITEAGRAALRSSGIAPPEDRLEQVVCPYCGARDNVLQNLFGATSCRSLFYCDQCRNPFEAFKPL